MRHVENILHFIFILIIVEAFLTKEYFIEAIFPKAVLLLQEIVWICLHHSSMFLRTSATHKVFLEKMVLLKTTISIIEIIACMH